METRRLIARVAILLMAGNAVGQDSPNRNAVFPEDFSTSGNSQSIAAFEAVEPESQTFSKSRRGQHHIQFSIGLLSHYGVESEVSVGGAATVVGGDGFLGSIAYNYWVQHDLALGVSVGVIGSEVNTSIGGTQVSVETGSVVPILFGIKYQPLMMRLSESVRPYVFASVGPCVGSVTRSRTGTSLENETYSETALGSHFGVGIEVVLSKVFVTGISAGYYLASDFDRPVGGRKNYSSPEFSLSLGILLGSGKE